MLEKPKLPDHKILTCLNHFFALKAQNLEFLPLGNDSGAWVYRVETDTKDYFLKVRKGIPKLSALQIPHYLQQSGIANIVAPIPTRSGELYAPLDDFSLIMYDMIKGGSAWGVQMSDDQLREWGRIMRRIHETPISDDLAKIVRRETFTSQSEAKFKRANALVQTETFDDPIKQDMADYWKHQQKTIDRVFQRIQEIGNQLKTVSHEFMICHSDIHQANIMIDEQGQIQIVDWDGAMIAPKERDLMFFVEDGHASHTVNAFLQGYGETDISQLAITYYKYEWVIQELSDYGERIFFNDDFSDNEKQFSLDEFKRLFSAGDVVEAAFQSDAKL